jgi:threonine/homoserine/homoserine lactone efflux protein
MADAAKAFVFGALLALAVGPIALLIMQRGLSYGLSSSVPSAIGVALADLSYALVAFSAGSLLLPYFHAHGVLWRMGSALVLIAVGAYLFGCAVRVAGNTQEKPPSHARSMVGDAASIYFLTLANPLTLLVFMALMAQLRIERTLWSVSLHAALVFLGSLLVQLVWASGSAALGSALGRTKWVQALNFLSYGAIIAFGLYGLVQAGGDMRSVTAPEQ